MTQSNAYFPHDLAQPQPLAPWFFKDQYIEPQHLQIPWGHPLAQWGWGAFTTGRMKQGIFEAGYLHVERLIKHSEALSISTPSKQRIHDSLSLWLNSLKAPESEVKIKLSIIYPGDLVFSAYSIANMHQESALKLMHSPEDTLHPKRGLSAHLKTHSYVDYLLLKKRAEKEGFYDALLCDQERIITETSTAAFWFIDNDTVFFPDSQKGDLLESITRELLTKNVPFEINKNWRGDLSSIPSTARCYISNCMIGVRQVGQAGRKTFSLDDREHRCLQNILHQASLSTAVYPYR